MARDVIILMRANPLQGHRKGWALKIDTFLALRNAPLLMGANPLQGPFEEAGSENRDYLEINSNI